MRACTLERLTEPVRRLHCVGAALHSPGAIRRWQPGVLRADAWPSDVGEHQATHAAAPGRAGDVHNARMAAKSTAEPDWSIPTGCVGEHEVSTRGPLWELPELRCPHDPPAVGL